MKLVVLNCASEQGYALEPEEILFLKDETPEARPNGIISTRTGFVAFEKTVRAVLRIYRDRLATGLELDFASHEWGIFQKAVKVRNRITHPRSPEDLDISSIEDYWLEQGLAWFHSQTIALFNKAAEKSQLSSSGAQ